MPPKKAVNQESERLQRENEVLKQQLADASPRKLAPVQFETTDPNLAQRYAEAGGRVASVTHIHPRQSDGTSPMKAGKRVGFAETKEELDALVKRASEEGRA